MSQLSFLESVIHWDETQCQQNVGEALPKLLSLLQQCEDIQEQIGVTKVICVSLLPWIQLTDAQAQVFSPLATKSSSLLDALLQNLEELCQASGNQEQVRSALEMLIELLDSFVCCMKFIQDKAHNSVPLCDSAPLLSAAIHILQGTYSHCKDSGDLYGDMLAGITELLSELFKKAHTLQVALLGVLEKVTVEGHVTHQDVDNLLQICRGLFQLCHIVTSLDTKLLCGLWKTLSRFSVRHKESVGDELNIDEMITFLSSELTTAVKNTCQLAPKHTDTEELVLSQGDMAAFQKALKVAGYQMKILTFMLDNFVGGVGASIHDVIALILTIHRCLPPSLSAPSILPQHVDEIQRYVGNAVEPIVTLFVGHDRFIDTLMIKQNGECPGGGLPYLQLLIKVVDCLPLQKPDVQRKWLVANGNHGEMEDLMDHLFVAVSDCYTEMHAQITVPGIPCNGKPAQPMSLYEYICTHMCSLIGCYPAHMFAALETCLLRHLLSPISCVSTLAADLWCFMARYGTAELCSCQTDILIQVYIKLQTRTSGSGQPVLHLINRIIKFLAPEHQTGLLKKFPPASHPDLWTQLTLTLFPVGSRSQVVEVICRKVSEAVQKFVHNGRKTYNDLVTLTQTVERMNLFLHDLDDTPLPSAAAASLMTAFQQLWSVLAGHWQTDPYFQTIQVQLVTLAGHLVGHLREHDLLQVLQQLPKQLESPGIKLAVAQFLLKICKLQFSPHTQLSETLGRIPQLYQGLLTDSHCIVHHEALDSFTQFAESTPYESLVPQCLDDNQALQEKVVDYLNQTPHSCLGLEEMEYLDRQKSAVRQILVDTTQSAPCNHGDMLDQISDIEEPVTKRKRIDDDDNDEGCSPEITAVLADLRVAVKHLETIKTHQSVTSATREELKSIHVCLKNVIDDL